MRILHLGPKGRPLPSPVVYTPGSVQGRPFSRDGNPARRSRFCRIYMALRLRPPGPACLNLPAGFAALPAAPRRSSLQILDKRCPSAKCCSLDGLCNYSCELVRRGSGGSGFAAKGMATVTSEIHLGRRVTGSRAPDPLMS
jgi:hypothetical protein